MNPLVFDTAVQEPFTETLERLRINFLESMELRILKIEQAWLVASDVSEPSSVQASRILIDEVHKISGVAGSLGLPSVGMQARALEGDLKKLGDIGVDPCAKHTLNERIDAFLDLLERHVA